MGTQKLLIVPWLIEQLDSQRYPGVSWLNSEKTLFRVPWKHLSRQNSNPKDFQIFEGETQENVLSSLDCSNSNNEDCLMWYQTLSPSQLDPVSSISPMALLKQTDGTNEFVPYSGIAAENILCYENPPSSNLELHPPIAMMSPLEQLITNPFETDFEVQTFYRGRQVLHKLISKVNSQGLCFVPPGVSGNYPDLEDVSLPDPTTLSDKLQAKYTLRLLKGVAPGVHLRIMGNQLCGMRKGVCHVWWSQSEIPGDGILHGNLLKEQFVPIFNMQVFISELIGYIEGSNGCPNYTRWLCFGEEWPDSNSVWKKKLIMVKVVPKVLETLCELGKSYGASSLKDNEPDLRISDSLQQQHLLEQLRKWEEKMDTV
ncbi:interferon regulatory factor 3 isoform 3-T4 [Vipera latastei]